MMLITYTGRRSGKRYTVPVNYLEIAASGERALYTTSYRQRVWWRNLRGGAEVTIRLRGVDKPARVLVIEQPEWVAGELEVYLRSAPQLGRYLGVNCDASGAVDVNQLRRAADKMVVVKTTL